MKLCVRALASLAFAAIVTLIVACGGEDNNEASPTSTVHMAVTATPVQRSDIDEIEPIIDAVLANDTAAFLALNRFMSRPCVSQELPETIAEPVCRDETPATPVEFIPEIITGLCNIAARTQELRPEEIGSLLDLDGFDELYAVHRAGPWGQEGETTVVFVGDSEDSRFPVVSGRLAVEGDRVVSLNYHCALTQSELVENIELEDFLLHEPADRSAAGYIAERRQVPCL